jgi:hypothetical protein
MAGVEFLDRFDGGVGRVVLGLQLFIGDLFHRDAFDKAGGEERAALVLEAQFHRFGHVLGRDVGQDLLLHQLLQHTVEQDLRRELLILRRQHGAHCDQVADGDVIAVHGGQNGVGIDLHFGIAVLSGER